MLSERGLCARREALRSAGWEGCGVWAGCPHPPAAGRPDTQSPALHLASAVSRGLKWDVYLGKHPLALC